MTYTIDQLDNMSIEDLFEVALKDAEEAQKAGIVLDMADWVDCDNCTVCLAGSVLINTVKEPAKFLKTNRLPDFMNRIEQYRSGIVNELENLDILFNKTDLRVYRTTFETRKQLKKG